jgi:hypothetical protein
VVKEAQPLADRENNTYLLQRNEKKALFSLPANSYPRIVYYTAEHGDMAPTISNAPLGSFSSIAGRNFR